jgi:hypothetical protein
MRRLAHLVARRPRRARRASGLRRRARGLAGGSGGRARGIARGLGDGRLLALVDGRRGLGRALGPCRRLSGRRGRLRGALRVEASQAARRDAGADSRGIAPSAGSTAVPAIQAALPGARGGA